MSLPVATGRFAAREVPPHHVAVTPDGGRAVAWRADGHTMLDADEAVVRLTGAEVAHAAPSADQLWTGIERRGAKLVIVRGGHVQAIELPEAALAAGVIAGGSAIARGALAVRLS